MQGLNWNDLKYALALYRAGTMTSAARHLGVNETTISRRIKALEASTGIDLFVRTTAGRYHPSETGMRLLAHAEQMEGEATALGEALGHETGKLTGTVRLTSVPVVINRIIVPALDAFLIEHPELKIELIPDARDFNLTQREADLALRLARPNHGGTQVKAQRLGDLSYDIFAAASLADEEARQLDWITYDDLHAHLPQARWLATVSSQRAIPISGLRIADAETAIEAVVAGLGQTLLPRQIALGDPRLKRVRHDQLPPLPKRDVWLLSHANQSKLLSVRSVANWLRTLRWDK